MQRTFLLILFMYLMAAKLSGQITYTPNTYYVIPPTTGCNGVWAIEDTLHCPLYLINSCFSFDHVNGDTLFLALCSLPCDYISADAMGNPCTVASCEYTATSVVTLDKTSESNIVLYPNPSSDFINIETDFKNFSFSIFDSMGRLVFRNDTCQNATRVYLADYSPGLYCIQLLGDDQMIGRNFIKQ